MGFRDNLLKKLKIKGMARKVILSINPADGTQRIDSDTMRQLLDMGTYPYQKERDLDLYRLDEDHILVMDNELKIYKTTVDDIALRKSPTIKEMVSFRNAIKILNDKDVVVSRKADTVRKVKLELIDSLDLSFTESDIDAMAKDGIEAMKNNYSDGVVETLALFAELLGYEKAPKAFRIAHHHIWGKLSRTDSGEKVFGPMVIFSLMKNSLKLHQTPIPTSDAAHIKGFRQAAKGEKDVDTSGDDVMNELCRRVFAQPRGA